ncbi:MAG: hypothetical protein UX17_C0071G0006 [Parcubacteria group bacterium GW2011_GWC2_45_7]|nr:MAG: hypothetical protein UX17_C0071G0006 [Parcubacteria group bacterium GW2011_GWC2_45_7]
MTRLSERWGNLPRAIALATALHGGAAASLYHEEIHDRVAESVQKTERKLRLFYNEMVKKFGEEIGKTRLGDKVDDPGVFYLLAELERGGISKTEMQSALTQLTAIRKKYKSRAESAKEEDGEKILRLIHDILQERGSYLRGSSFMADLLNNKEANCEAMTKYVLSIVPSVFPELPIFLQYAIVNGTYHIRPIIQVRGAWYALEHTTIPLNNKDLDGTVMMSANSFIKDFLGDPPQARLIRGNTPDPSAKLPVNKYATDSLFSFANIPEPTRVLGDDGPVPRKVRDVPTTFEDAQTHLQQAGRESVLGGPTDIELFFPDETKDEPSTPVLAEARPYVLQPEVIMHAKVTGVLKNVTVYSRDAYQARENWLEIETSNAGEDVKSHTRQRYHDLLYQAQHQRLDMSGVKNVPLTEIRLGGGIVDFSQLDDEALRNLRLLTLWHCDIIGREHLQRTTNLKAVALNSCAFDNIKFLSGMRLESFELEDTPVSDISPLARSPLTRSFDAHDAPVNNYDVLRGKLTRSVTIRDAHLTSIDFIRDMPDIETAQFINSPITDISALAHHNKLSIVTLLHTKASDISPLATIPIGVLNIIGSPFTDLSPLRKQIDEGSIQITMDSGFEIVNYKVVRKKTSR